MSLFPVGFSRRKTGYEIARSLRLRTAATSYLTKTPGSVGVSRRKFTWSGWVKRGNITVNTGLFGTSDSGAGAGYGVTFLGFLASGVLRFVTSRASDGQTFIWFDSTNTFLDPNAHYHVHIAVDIDQATAANGCRIWVNNRLLSGTFNFYMSGNDMFANHTVPQYIGRVGSVSPGYYPDSYMSEIHMIDGQTLDPSGFGTTDSAGIWQPKKYTGTYGVNGYYLPFVHGTSLAELGFDCKPNSFREVAHGGIVGSSLTTAEKPFGTSSIYVNGAYGSYVLYAADGRNTLGTGQFCVRAWVKDLGKVAPPALNGQNNILSQGDNAGNAMWRLCLDNTSRQIVWGFTGAAIAVSASYPVSTGVWHEIVVTRDASNIERIFLDGRLVNSRSNTTNYNAASGSYVHLGCQYDTNYPGTYGVNARAHVLNGYLKDVSFTTGYIPDAYQTASTTVGAQIWVPKAEAFVTDAKLNKGWAYTGFYVPAEGANASTVIPCLWQTHFTQTNVSLTAGVTYDWMTDTPSNNFPTISDLTYQGAGPGLVQNGNLAWREATGSTAWKTRITTMAIPTSGKWYAEFTVTYTGSQPYNAGANSAMIGLHDGLAASFIGASPGSYGYGPFGIRYNNSVLVTGFGSAWPTTCTVRVAYDADTGQLWFGLNGTWTGGGNPALGTSPAYTGVTGEKFFAFSGAWISPDGVMWIYPNFGQQPWAQSIPAGFKALSSKNVPNSPINVGAEHMDAVLYVGDNTNNRVLTFPRFDPDFVWFKQRQAVSHYLNDRVRGNDKALITNLTNTESPYTGYFAFGALGTKQVTISYTGSGGVDFGYNQNGFNYIAWLWKGGGAPVTNTAGSTTTQVSANPVAGFSVITYLGNNTAGATVGHGLGKVPHFVIVKARSQTTNWTVYHRSLPNTQYLLLSTTGAAVTAAVWNNATPSTTVITLGGTGQGVNNAGIDYVAYVFTEIPGFSKFGSYVGNGVADGTYVYCGFKPRYIMFKRVTGTSEWVIIDTLRNPGNPQSLFLTAESLNAEQSALAVDILSNGFKWRSNIQFNGAGTYIFAAFAEYPFKNSRAF